MCADEGCGEDQMSAEEEELRRFDIDMKYGPCIGVTRLRRWERAAVMGLRPPPHIHDLMLRRVDPAGWSPSRSSAPKNSAGTDSHPSSSASLKPTSLQLQCIWEGKI
jgi:DNA polymerase delta subunit 4